MLVLLRRRRALRPRASLLLLLCVLGGALGAAGCASRGPRVRPRTAGATPWTVPTAELATQRLFQARLSSPEGRGRFRLLLRLRDPERYQIRATHPLFNRRLWSLDVEGDRAVLVDHHQRTVCRYQDQAEIGAVPLGPFPFASLPALLLGYLPLPPAERTAQPRVGRLAFEDAAGRHWAAVLEDGVVRRWEVEGEEIGRVRWEVREGWDVLEAPSEELELRLRQTVHEALTAPVEPLGIPEGYDAQSDCDLGWLRAVEDVSWEENEDERNGRD